MQATRVDLHVHSSHSNRPNYWAMRTINCPESYTPPLDLYHAAKRQGMDYVTITDHNTISGNLEIAHLPDVFISSELTCHFPEDGCKVHVVVLGVTEQQFAELARIRKNIYETVSYLRKEQIAHFLAHPLYAQNDRLSADHIEKSLLLFTNFEVRNGARSHRFNQFMKKITATLTPIRLEQLANRHNLEPYGTQPWHKGLIGGSDDHSGLFIGRAWTEVMGGETVAGYLDAVYNGFCRPGGDDGDPLTLAHSLYGIAYNFYQEQQRPKRGRSAPFITQLLNHLFGQVNGTSLSLWDKTKLFLRKNWPEAWDHGDGHSFETMLDREAQYLLSDKNFIEQLQGVEGNRRIFAVTSRLINRMLFRYTEQLTRMEFKGGLSGLFNSLGTIGLLHLMASPYYVAFHHQHRGKELLTELGSRMNISTHGEEKIALFTDTLDEINGVAMTIRRLIATARGRGVSLTVITSGDSNRQMEGVMNFPSLGKIALPEYPELTLHFPPILDIMEYLEREAFTHIHISTPGTVGLLGLTLSHLMNLPVAGTYHTDIPQYVGRLSNDEFLEQVAWNYMIWFYGRMDEVLIPSAATRQQLVERGLPQEKTLPLPRWVDTDQFSPRLRRSGYYRVKGLDDGPILLYVGRVSREKGLELLADVFKQVVDSGIPVGGLAIIGDGPYQEEMVKTLQGYPVLFTGFLQGEELAIAYASADLFVFPSATDTFGNVVLEAQASGLPVIVTNQGGPQELMINQETGLIVEAEHAPSLTEAIASLLNAPEQLTRMGSQARHYIETNAPSPDITYATILRQHTATA